MSSGLYRAITLTLGEQVVPGNQLLLRPDSRHRWGNRGAEPAVLAVFITGAHRAS